MTEIITRAEAKARGLKRYFTGKPCRNKGHVAERLTSNGNCMECKREQGRAARSLKNVRHRDERF
jgi:hypothetical protein